MSQLDINQVTDQDPTELGVVGLKASDGLGDHAVGRLVAHANPVRSQVGPTREGFISKKERRSHRFGAEKDDITTHRCDDRGVWWMEAPWEVWPVAIWKPMKWKSIGAVCRLPAWGVGTMEWEYEKAHPPDVSRLPKY